MLMRSIWQCVSHSAVPTRNQRVQSEGSLIHVPSQSNQKGIPFGTDFRIEKHMNRRIEDTRHLDKGSCDIQAETDGDKQRHRKTQKRQEKRKPNTETKRHQNWDAIRQTHTTFLTRINNKHKQRSKTPKTKSKKIKNTPNNKYYTTLETGLKPHATFGKRQQSKSKARKTRYMRHKTADERLTTKAGTEEK